MKKDRSERNYYFYLVYSTLISLVVFYYIISGLISAFTNQDVYDLPLIYIGIQLLFYIYVFGFSEYKFRFMTYTGGGFGLDYFMYVGSCFLYIFFLPYLCYELLIETMLYFSSPEIIVNYTSNPFFAYPVLLIIDVIFILSLHFIHKKAMQNPQERKI
jgi:hypothetical protein